MSTPNLVRPVALPSYLYPSRPFALLGRHPLYLKPEDGDKGSEGAAADRGDNWTPTLDDDAKELKAELDKKEAAKAKPDPEAKDDEVKDKETKAEKDPDDDIDPDDPDGEKAKADKGGEGAKDGEKGAKKDTRVPLSRHKEILQAERDRREALETELRQYRQGTAIADTNKEITALEEKLLKGDEEYAKLITDGEHEKAAAKMKELRALEREVSEKKADMRTAASEARAVEQVRYDMTVERMEEAYPELNPDHQDFDKAKTAEVLELKAGFQATGRTPTQALQKAIKYVMGAPKTVAEKKAVEVEARVTKEDAEEAKAEAAKAERLKAQRAKNLDAEKKTPPNSAKVGADSDKMGGGITAKDVMKMTQDDFRKLTDADLARMRGDEIEA